jgi:hypothetical protein
MQSEELLELTASEPLSMDEELEMQRELSHFNSSRSSWWVGKWHLDEDSTVFWNRAQEGWCWYSELTFILLERPDHLPSSEYPLLSPEEIKGCRMVGDVNMFLPDGIDQEGECEIMIAGAPCHTGEM